jgi:cardiolipin synthase
MFWPWLAAACVVWWAEAAAVIAAEYRRPAHAAAWLFVLLALPIVGFIPFLLARGRTGLGDTRDRMPAVRAAGAADDAFPEDKRLRRALGRMSDAPITDCNGTEILTDGEEAFASIFGMIEKAEHHIHLAYYILRDDGVGRRFRDALIRKAREGVQVRLIYDGFGSWKLKRSYIRELAEAGVKARCFLPLGAALGSRRLNHRYHRKIVVVDGKSGFTGGINIGDEYLGQDKKIGFWRDTHLRVEGDAVYELQNIFVRDWQLASGEALHDPAYWPPHACTSRERVQIVSCGPRLGGNEIYDGLLAVIGAARERIWIATPYFVPDAGLTAALRTAAGSGVDVRLIVPGVADTRFVLAATLSHAADLRAAGVRVYRYQKGFIHAKVMIVDRLLASVGTANLDMRSFYSNYELNALLFDEKPIGRMERDFLQDFADSREVTEEELRGTTAGAQAGRAMARLLSPLL